MINIDDEIMRHALAMNDYTNADDLRRDLALATTADAHISELIDSYTSDAFLNESDLDFIDEHESAIRYRLALSLLDSLALDDNA